MTQFELIFKNKPVRVEIKEDGHIVLNFDSGDRILLRGTDSADKFTIVKTDIAIAKEDLSLLGKLLDKGIKQSKQMDRINF